jgi:NADH-quinone oxidoreductase subunit L
MLSATNIALIPLLPLLGFVLLGLFGKQLKPFAGILATVLILVSAVLASGAAWTYFFANGRVNDVYQTIIPLNIEWLRFNDQLSIQMGLLVDPISVMMLVVVTLISLMVHIYSNSYMHGEKRFATYFAYLQLFTFSMLGLVLATNIFQTYFFWELVGVSSFLLIGYYYDKPSAVAASKKAFIVTRFADLGFLIGILVLSFYGGSLDFQTLIQQLTTPHTPALDAANKASFLGVSALTWGLSLVFIGGAGKSALFPLHIWLPDAMEGPTPVSALIHAATMVVAGVYLVARLFPVYAISAPELLAAIGWVGAISAVIAALIACTQTDIKRVLAYSTMSQIGYMMFALGVSGYGGEAGLGFTASMFHLFTHALFKALLFLGAGAVIHAVHSNEMHDMGGLRKQMPITHISFLIACLAIAGVPPLSGFFSKEEILLAAYQNNTPIYWIALITSGLTAFYMFRLYFRIFWSKPHTGHAHEASAIMWLPLVLLAVGAAFAGLIPFGELVSSDGKALHSELHLSFSIAPVVLGVLGILMAAWLYGKENEKPASIQNSLGGLFQAVYHKLYIDELYLFLTKSVVFALIAKPAAWIDQHIINAAVNGSASITQKISSNIKTWQSGKVQDYGLYFLGGVIGLAVLVLYIW